MEIKKITLQDGGLKGCLVTYVTPETKSNRTLPREHTDKVRHPIHFGLEKPFKDLRFHLLEICGLVNDEMKKSEIDYVINCTEVTGIKLDGGRFVIMGIKEVFTDKHFKLETPMIEAEDEYEHFGTVCKIIDTILEETKLYMQGEAKVSDAEIIERWIAAGKQKGFDKESFNNLPDDEKKKLCAEILETKFGAVVIMEEDISIGDIEKEEVSTDFSQEEPAAEEEQDEEMEQASISITESTETPSENAKEIIITAEIPKQGIVLPRQ